MSRRFATDDARRRNIELSNINRREREARQRQEEAATERRSRLAVLDTDPAVLLYRATKKQTAKRRARKHAKAMDAAAQAFKRNEELKALAQKGGRPKSKGIAQSLWGRKSVDPADALVRALRPQDEGAW